jgi:F0F1-type ATP synthase assembly protein I
MKISFVFYFLLSSILTGAMLGYFVAHYIANKNNFNLVYVMISIIALIIPHIMFYLK